MKLKALHCDIGGVSGRDKGLSCGFIVNLGSIFLSRGREIYSRLYIYIYIYSSCPVFVLICIFNVAAASNVRRWVFLGLRCRETLE